jgi:hypothetical protein
MEYSYGETDLDEILQLSRRLEPLADVNARVAEKEEGLSIGDNNISSNRNEYNGQQHDVHQSRHFLQSMKDDSTLARLPPRATIDELVSLYFRYLHPFCPIVNEPFFMKELNYANRNLDDFLDKYPAIVFYAILSVAIGVSDCCTLSFESASPSPSPLGNRTCLS